jgi:mevalonate kinase
LGSSSTLLSNIAQWTGANPYELLEKTFGGSGYDIACATSQGPIVYTKVPKRKIETVNWKPSYKNQLWLIYFGKKQDTAISLVNYKNIVPSKDDIKRISKITEEISLVDNVSDFGKLIEEHEQILSNTLNLKTLKQQHFSSFKGYIKSLGAWGGDFFLAASPENEEYVKKYFALKGYNTIFPFEKMVKFY